MNEKSLTHTTIYTSPQGEKIIQDLYDHALRQWPVPFEGITIPTRYGDTFVLVSGEASAPPLVLFHGAGTNSMMWRGDIAIYSQDYRTYAVDLLGEPGKSAPTRPSWEESAYVEWVEDIFAALRLTKAGIVGISQGAWTALRFATAHPERLEKLVLLTPGGIVPDNLTFLFRAMLYRVLGKKGDVAMVKMLYGDWTVSREVGDVTTLFMTHFKPRLGTLPIFTDAELRRLTMPTLLLVGTKDALRNGEKIAARLQPLLAYLKVEIIPGGGHALVNTVEGVVQFLATGDKAQQG